MKETPKQKIARLEREKTELLRLLDRYMPEAMFKPRMDEYLQWERDGERIRKLDPSWR